MEHETPQFKLVRKLDQVLLRFGDGRDDLPVRLAWARPVYSRGRDVCILTEKKSEVVMVSSLDALDAESRSIAQDELARRYLIPTITRVISANPHLGNRYWHVETELGERKFLMKDPTRNVVWITGDHLILRDALGNRYEVASLSALDAFSRAEVLKVV